jgi:hypothetical protein
MAQKDYDFNSGSAGNAVSTGIASPDSLVNVVSPAEGSITYATTSAYKGALGAHVPAVTVTTSDNWSLRMADAISTNTSFAVRAYIKLAALPSTEIQFGLNITTSADSSLCRAQLTAGGLVRVNGGGTNGSLSAAAISTNAWQRWELTASGLNGAAGAATLNIYDLDSTSPVVTASFSGFTTSSTAARAQVFKGSSGTLGACEIDDFSLNGGSAIELGPTASPPPAMSFAKLLTIGT